MSRALLKKVTIASLIVMAILILLSLWDVITDYVLVTKIIGSIVIILVTILLIGITLKEIDTPQKDKY